MPTIDEFYARYTRDGLVGVSTKDIYIDYIAWSITNDRAIVTRLILTRAVCHNFALKTARVCRHGTREQVFSTTGGCVCH